MSVLIRPKRWGQKPPLAPSIDFGHPIASGLVGAWLFNEQGGAKAQNLAGPLQGSLVTTYSWHPEGVELSNDTSATGRTNLGDIRITGDMTVLCSYMPLRISASFDVSVISKYDNGARPANCEWILGGNLFASAGDARQFFGISSGTTLALAGAAAGDTATVGTRYALAGTRRGTALTVYRNGKIIGSTTGPSGAINTGTGRVVKLGEIDNGAGNNSNSRFYYAYLWNRALTQGELQALYVEPYAFLNAQSPRRRVWVPSGSTVSVTSSVASTWNTATAVSKTTSSTWNTALQVTASRASTWATAQAVTASKASTWNTAVAVSTSRQSTWAVRTALTQTVTSTWSTRVLATATAASTWNVANRITASTASTWNTARSLTQTATSTWGVRQSVTVTTTGQWNTAAQVTTTVPSTWNVAVVYIPTPTPSERIYLVSAEQRVFRVPAEIRVHLVPAEQRTFLVTP